MTHQNRSGRIYRTLREAQALDDYAGRVLGRFPRTGAEAGLPPEPRDDDSPSALGFVALLATALVGGFLWFVLLLGWSA